MSVSSGPVVTPPGGRGTSKEARRTLRLAWWRLGAANGSVPAVVGATVAVASVVLNLASLVLGRLPS